MRTPAPAYLVPAPVVMLVAVVVVVVVTMVGLTLALALALALDAGKKAKPIIQYHQWVFLLSLAFPRCWVGEWVWCNAMQRNAVTT